MAVGELWTGRRQQGTGTGGQAQLGRAGTGGWLGSLFWADGLSIETQTHTLFSCPSSFEYRQHL